MTSSSNGNNYLKIINCYDKYINSIQSSKPFVCVISSTNWTNPPRCSKCGRRNTVQHTMGNGHIICLCRECCYDSRDEISHWCEDRKKSLDLSLAINQTLYVFEKSAKTEKEFVDTVKNLREEILRLQNEMEISTFIEWLRYFVLYLSYFHVSLLQNNRTSLFYLAIYDALTAENLELLRERMNQCVHPAIESVLFEIYYNLFVKTESGEYVWKKD